MSHGVGIMDVQGAGGKSPEFVHEYPTARTVERIFDDQDLHRAVEAYRFFYPTVSAEAGMQGIRDAGVEDGKALAVVAIRPHHVFLTANSDTPYAMGTLDLRAMGPIVIELPEGPFIGVVNDHNQRWVADMGIPGPDQGRGGKHLILPPGFEGSIPPGYHVAHCGTGKALIVLRCMPTKGDVGAAIERVRELPIHSLSDPRRKLAFVDVTDRPIEATPQRWEENLEYWLRLHALIDQEPTVDEYRPMYGLLAALGIEKGRDFSPDPRTQQILEAAAREGIARLLVEGLASQRRDRLVWPDRRWEWLGLSPDANFETDSFLDLQARDRWFGMTCFASPAFFRRQAGRGSMYWMATRDNSGAWLDGGADYVLSVPQPVPASLFWSVTAYDARTRSEVRTQQDKAALGSLGSTFEETDGTIEFHFGPERPAAKQGQWIQTEPGKGFFLLFRVYGPEEAALNGSWKLADLQKLPSREVLQ